jgi:serine kinase of HPr protein (carbohydrate metabolism regulator)
VSLGDALRRFGGPDGIAVLLTGASGSGKSDVALRLIAEGGKLISDDQTLLSSDGHHLFAEGIDSIAGQIEIRGVGIIGVPHAGKTPIALVVRLDAGAAAARLPEPALYVPPPPLSASHLPPLLTLPPFEPSTTAKITAAAAAAVSGRFVAGVAP